MVGGGSYVAPGTAAACATRWSAVAISLSSARIRGPAPSAEPRAPREWRFHLAGSRSAPTAGRLVDLRHVPGCYAAPSAGLGPPATSRRQSAARRAGLGGQEMVLRSLDRAFAESCRSSCRGVRHLEVRRSEAPVSGLSITTCWHAVSRASAGQDRSTAGNAKVRGRKRPAHAASALHGPRRVCRANPLRLCVPGGPFISCTPRIE